MTSKQYDKIYYEQGIEHGVSGYSNYHWVPEVSLAIAHELIVSLGIKSNSKVLDYGCAKGFLVKAFDILGHPKTYGIDVSEYAISKGDPSIKDRLVLLDENTSCLSAFTETFDWVIAKDVFEHIPETDLRNILRELAQMTTNMFVVVPLGDGQKYIVPEYEKDITHVIRQPLDWWSKLFQDNEFEVIQTSYEFGILKRNWSHYPKGNGFFVLRSRMGEST